MIDEQLVKMLGKYKLTTKGLPASFDFKLKAQAYKAAEAAARARQAAMKKARGGFVRIPQMRLPKLKGAVGGAGPVAGPMLVDMGLNVVNEATDGTLENACNNTIGRDPADMWNNLKRLLGPERSRHWSHIFENYGPTGLYSSEARAEQQSPSKPE